MSTTAVDATGWAGDDLGGTRRVAAIVEMDFTQSLTCRVGKSG